MKDKKLKKLVVAFKFLYILTVLSLNSNLFYQCFLLVLFACKDPSPLYKSSKRRNHLQPENLETLFLPSALKLPIKSVTSYQAEIKYLEESQLSFDFLDFATVYSYFNVQMCSYFIVGNKIFCFFKKCVFAFLDEGTFQEGMSQFLQNFEGGCS